MRRETPSASQRAVQTFSPPPLKRLASSIWTSHLKKKKKSRERTARSTANATARGTLARAHGGGGAGARHLLSLPPSPRGAVTSRWAAQRGAVGRAARGREGKRVSGPHTAPFRWGPRGTEAMGEGTEKCFCCHEKG